MIIDSCWSSVHQQKAIPSDAIRGIHAEEFAAEVAWVINRTVEKWGAWNRPGVAKSTFLGCCWLVILV